MMGMSSSKTSSTPPWRINKSSLSSSNQNQATTIIIVTQGSHLSRSTCRRQIPVSSMGRVQSLMVQWLSISHALMEVWLVKSSMETMVVSQDALSLRMILSPKSPTQKRDRSTSPWITYPKPLSNSHPWTSVAHKWLQWTTITSFTRSICTTSPKRSRKTNRVC